MVEEVIENGLKTGVFRLPVLITSEVESTPARKLKLGIFVLVKKKISKVEFKLIPLIKTDQ